MSEPTTEAGRRHVDWCRTFLGDDAEKEVCAIEREARAQALAEAQDTIRLSDERHLREVADLAARIVGDLTGMWNGRGGGYVSEQARKDILAAIREASDDRRA